MLLTYLAVIDVTNRTNVHVRLRSLENCGIGTGDVEGGGGYILLAHSKLQRVGIGAGSEGMTRGAQERRHCPCKRRHLDFPTTLQPKR